MTGAQWLKDRKKYLLIGIGALLLAFSPLVAPAPDPKTVTIPIQASSFEFLPGVIEVNQGDTVVIELTAMDVVHGLYLDGYGISAVADPGQTTTLTFTADRTGTYRFRCSVTCGALHPFMVGKLKVGNNNLAWWATISALSLGAASLWSVLDDRKKSTQ